MCTRGTVAQIFIDSRTLHIKRLAGKFKQHTNVPYRCTSTVTKKSVTYQRIVVSLPLQKRCNVYFLAKIDAYRIYLRTLPYRTAILRAQSISCTNYTIKQKKSCVKKKFCGTLNFESITTLNAMLRVALEVPMASVNFLFFVFSVTTV